MPERTVKLSAARGRKPLRPGKGHGNRKNLLPSLICGMRLSGMMLAKIKTRLQKSQPFYP